MQKHVKYGIRCTDVFHSGTMHGGRFRHAARGFTRVVNNNDVQSHNIMLT